MVTKTPKTPCGSTEKCPAFPVVKKKKKSKPCDSIWI